MGRSTFAILFCALACAFTAGLALASAVPTHGAGDGSTTNTSSDTLPDEGPGPAPSVAQPPKGVPVAGHRLSVPAALAGSVHYQWQACRRTKCASIKGATKPTLLLTKSLVGKTVRVVATTDAGVTIASTSSKPVRAKR